MADADTFTGFPPEALGFLRAVDFYQDRAWFQDNKAIYEAAIRAPFEALLRDAARAFAARGLPITADPARGLFRLQRDVRFSRDKRPYKTSTGAVMTRSGRKDSPGLVYVHLDPKGCFIAAGFWQPEPRQLLALRRHILAEPAAYAGMLAALAGKGLALDPEHGLKRNPRGFEAVADPALAAAIRLTSFIVRLPVEEGLMADAALVPRLADFTEDCLPLLRFFWTALEKATA